MYYIIYETINTINGKRYIGKHVSETLEDLYLGSGLILKKSIKKYGKENFKRTNLFVFSTEDEMNQKEKDLITLDIINDNDYYNMALGGDGGITVLNNNHPKYDETCKKISVGRLKQSEKISKITKELHVLKKVGMYGKQQSEYQKDIARKTQTGRIKSEKTISKQKHSLMETFSNSDYIHPNKGRILNEERISHLKNISINRIKRVCPHCNKILDPANYARYHGDKCKNHK